MSVGPLDLKSGGFAFGVALLASLLLTPLIRAAAHRWGLLDHPGPRSAHLVATPTGGGLAIVLAAGAALWAAPELPSAGGVALLAGVLLLALVGLADDRRGLPPALRLAAQLLAAGALVGACGGLARLPLPPPLDLQLGPFGALAALLWILLATNAYNFMDGIDGLAGLQGVITGIGLGLALGQGPGGALALGLAGGCAGFLLWNWSPASIFMGDVGSTVLGYSFAGLPLLLPAQGPRGAVVLLVALSLGLFLADTIWTRLKRLARGGTWWAAHREHAYQRLVASGVPHASVALALGFGALLLTVSGVALRSAPEPWGWPALGLAGSLFGAELLWLRRRERVPPRMV